MPTGKETAKGYYEVNQPLKVIKPFTDLIESEIGQEEIEARIRVE